MVERSIDRKGIRSWQAEGHWVDVTGRDLSQNPDQVTPMRYTRAISELNFPNKSRSGARKCSMTFMVATVAIWAAALLFQRMPDRIHAAMAISEMPIRWVSRNA